MVSSIRIKGPLLQETKEYATNITPYDIMLEENPETGNWEVPTVCLYAGDYLMRADWQTTILYEDAVVIWVEMPMGGGGGGGSNPLQAILSIVLVVVAVYTGGLATGALSAMGWGAAAAAAGGGLVTGAVIALGQMLLGGLVKAPSLPSSQSGGYANEEASPTYSINGSSNSARLWQKIPVGFGKMKIIPDVISQPWSEYIGNENYLNQVFMIGEGLYDVESMSFGDTIFWNKTGGIAPTYEIQVQFGLPGDKITLFPTNIEKSIEVSGQQLFSTTAEAYDGWVGPYATNPPGTLTTRIMNNIVFSGGIGNFNDAGKIASITVTYTFQYQKINDAGIPIGGWATLRNVSHTLATQTSQRFTHSNNIAAGRYQVRARRTDAIEQDGRSFDHCTWESMQSLLPGELIYDQSVVALRVKATNNLSQAASRTFSLISTRKLPLYNMVAKTWSAPTPTRSFAAAISWILKWQYGGGLKDKEIALDSLWGNITAELDHRSWLFNGYVDGFNVVYPLLLELCAPFRVVPRVTGGAIDFIFDKSGRPARYQFTAENIVRESFSIVYSNPTLDTPDDIIWSYLDENAGFQQRDVQVTLPLSTSTNPALKSNIGTTNRTQSFRQATFIAACNRHRRVSITFSCESVGKLIHMGDVLNVNHPQFYDVQTGTIEDWDANIYALKLNNPFVARKQGEFYYITLNAPDGTIWGPCKVSVYDIETRLVILDAADFARLLSNTGVNPFASGWLSSGNVRFATIWTLQESDNFTGRVIVQSVVPNDVWHHEITAVNDSPLVDSYDNLPVPEWNYRLGSGIVIGKDPPVTPANVEVFFQGTSGDADARMTWDFISNATHYLVEYAIVHPQYTAVASVALNNASIPVQDGKVFLRVAAVNAYGQSSWAYWSGDTSTSFEELYILTCPEGYIDIEAINLVITGPTLDYEANSGYRKLFIYDMSQPTMPLVRTVTLAVNQLIFQYTKIDAYADGGPVERMKFVLETIVTGPDANHGTSTLELALVRPPAVTNLTSCTDNLGHAPSTWGINFKWNEFPFANTSPYTTGWAIFYYGAMSHNYDNLANCLPVGLDTLCPLNYVPRYWGKSDSGNALNYAHFSFPQSDAGAVEFAPLYFVVFTLDALFDHQHSKNPANWLNHLKRCNAARIQGHLLAGPPCS